MIASLRRELPEAVCWGPGGKVLILRVGLVVLGVRWSRTMNGRRRRWMFRSLG